MRTVWEVFDVVFLFMMRFLFARIGQHERGLLWWLSCRILFWERACLSGRLRRLLLFSQECIMFFLRQMPATKRKLKSEWNMLFMVWCLSCLRLWLWELYNLWRDDEVKVRWELWFYQNCCLIFVSLWKISWFWLENEHTLYCMKGFSLWEAFCIENNVLSLISLETKVFY